MNHNEPKFPVRPPIAGGVTAAAVQRNFDIAGLIALAAISVLGTTAVYSAARRTLQPIQDLSGQMTAITENNLDVRVEVVQRADEVGTEFVIHLCKSKI